MDRDGRAAAGFNSPTVLSGTACPAQIVGTIQAMPKVTPLYEFIGVNRAELIRRCKVKVAKRAATATATAAATATATATATVAKDDPGVPLFLDQLVEELRHGPSTGDEINKAAIQHGRDLFVKGFSVSQVVHDYGDVCQSVTDLAMETRAPIATEDFRTLNRCLDDAIAGAVTEHARGQQVSRDGQSNEVRDLTNKAIAAFEVLQTGTIGIGGTTGTLVLSSLMKIRELINRPAPGAAGKDAGAKSSKLH